MNWQDWEPADMPPPMDVTDDMVEARRRMEEYGYVIIKNLLSPEEVGVVRNRLHTQAAAERALGIASLVTPPNTQTYRKADEAMKAGKPVVNEALPLGQFKEQFVAGILNKGEEFWPMVTHPVALEVVRMVLGSEFQLSSYVGTIVEPGCPLMGLHHDQWYMNSPQGRSGPPKIKSGDVHRGVDAPVLSNDPDELITPAYGVQSIWMLTDFTEEDGATRIVPKSNRSGVLPVADVPHPYRSIAAEGPVGSVLFYDSRLWHSSGEHRGSRTRFALHVTYCGPQVRTMDNFTVSIAAGVRRRMPVPLLELLGLKVWFGYGRGSTTGVVGLIDPDAPPIGRLELAN